MNGANKLECLSLASLTDWYNVTHQLTGPIRKIEENEGL